MPSEDNHNQNASDNEISPEVREKLRRKQEKRQQKLEQKIEKMQRRAQRNAQRAIDKARKKAARAARKNAKWNFETEPAATDDTEAVAQPKAKELEQETSEVENSQEAEQISAPEAEVAQEQKSEPAQQSEPKAEVESEKEPEPTPVVEEKPHKKSFFARLKDGLSKTRNGFVKNMDYVFNGFTNIDDDFYDEIEEILITGDIGVRTTDRIMTELREKVKADHIKDPKECRQILIDSIRNQMNIGEAAYAFEEHPSVVLMVGVNGVGKTTTIGKLAFQLRSKGKKVLLAAADTFRAAAGDQLKEWANRAQVDLIGGQEGSDPAAVVYDSVQAAKARHTDVLLVDTAGRLNNKKNLMQELAKINRIIDQQYPEAYRETLVVLDATTGQNALQQAKDFSEVTKVTGIVLTKMDGTAKGGIAVAIQSELGIPVKYIGIGETVDDLEKFNADTYVKALFTSGNDEEE